MKHYRVTAVFLVLCILASLTACIPSDLDQTDPETSQTTTAPTTTVPPTTTEPGPKTLHLKDYVTGIDTSVINDDTIITLLRHAETILQEYDIVIIEDNFEIKHFVRIQFRSELNDHEDDGNVIILDTKGSQYNDPDCLVTIHVEKISEAQHARFRYLVLAALLLQEYQDCYYNSNRDFFDGTPRNNRYSAAVRIIPSFADSGYNTMEELFEAARKKEYDVGEEGAYSIYLGGLTLRLYPLWTPEFWENSYNGNYWDDHYEKLLSKAFPEE